MTQLNISQSVINEMHQKWQMSANINESVQKRQAPLDTDSVPPLKQ